MNEILELIFCISRAAYQYGVKMADGRKGKNAKFGSGPKSEKDIKNKLDKEWTQISKVGVICFVHAHLIDLFSLRILMLD